MAFQTVSAILLRVAVENALGAFARLAARPRVRPSIPSGGRSLRIPPFFFGCIHLTMRALSGCGLACFRAGSEIGRAQILVEKARLLPMMRKKRSAPSRTRRAPREEIGLQKLPEGNLMLGQRRRS